MIEKIHSNYQSVNIYECIRDEHILYMCLVLRHP